MAGRPRSGRRFNRRRSMDQSKSSTGLFDIPGTTTDGGNNVDGGVRTRQLWSDSDEEESDIPDISGKVAKKKKGRRSWEGSASGTGRAAGAHLDEGSLRSAVQRAPHFDTLDEVDAEEVDMPQSAGRRHRGGGRLHDRQGSAAVGSRQPVLDNDDDERLHVITKRVTVATPHVAHDVQIDAASSAAGGDAGVSPVRRSPRRVSIESASKGGPGAPTETTEEDVDALASSTDATTDEVGLPLARLKPRRVSIEAAQSATVEFADEGSAVKTAAKPRRVSVESRSGSFGGLEHGTAEPTPSSDGIAPEPAGGAVDSDAPPAASSTAGAAAAVDAAAVAAVAAKNEESQRLQSKEEADRSRRAAQREEELNARVESKAQRRRDKAAAVQAAAEQKREKVARRDAEREAAAQRVAKEQALARKVAADARVVEIAAAEAAAAATAAASPSPNADPGASTPTVDYCRSCGLKADVQYCSKCLSVGYCSAKCQSADWKRHKKLCKSLTKERATQELGQVATYRPFTAQGARGDSAPEEAWSSGNPLPDAASGSSDVPVLGQADRRRKDGPAMQRHDGSNDGDIEVLYRSPVPSEMDNAENVDKFVVETNAFDPSRVDVRETQATSTLPPKQMLPGSAGNGNYDDAEYAPTSAPHGSSMVRNNPGLFDAEAEEDTDTAMAYPIVKPVVVAVAPAVEPVVDVDADAEFAAVADALEGAIGMATAAPATRTSADTPLGAPADSDSDGDNESEGGFNTEDEEYLAGSKVDAKPVMAVSSTQAAEDAFWEGVNRVEVKASNIITNPSLLAPDTEPRRGPAAEAAAVQTVVGGAVEANVATVPVTEPSRRGVLVDGPESNQDESAAAWRGRFGVVVSGPAAAGAAAQPATAAPAHSERSTALPGDDDGDTVQIPKMGIDATASHGHPAQPPALDERSIGHRVQVSGYGGGILAFVGHVRFAPEHMGEWLGVVLDDPKGKNDGSVKGTRYFQCQHKLGGVLLSRRSGLIKLDIEPKQTGSSLSAWAGARGDQVVSPVPDKKNPPKPRRVSVTAAPQELGETDSRVTRVAGRPGSASSRPTSATSKAASPGGMYNQPSGSHEVMGPRTEAPKVPLALRDRQVTPLHEAANTGNLVLLKKLIAKRAYPIDIDDGEGRSPLMHAVHRERLDCVAYLLSKGANVNLGADDGATPLHEACYNSTLAIVQLLLREGASPVSMDQDGRQPVHWATDNSRNEKPMCVLIDHHGVDVNCVDETGMTPLMWAACHDNPPMVSALIDRGAEMLEKDIDGKTAMDWAVRPDSIAVLAMIVDEASTYFKDRVGRTVMHTAAERGSVLAIEHILSIRPDAIEDEDKMFRSPLFWAAACDEIAAARVLLLKGADVHKEDCSGLTAIDYATAKEYDRMAEVLVVHRLNLEQLGMTQLRGGTGVSPTAGSRGSPGGSGQRAKNRGGGATQRLSSGSPQRSNAVAAALQRGGVMSPESRSSGGSNLKRSDSVTSLYATPAALGFAPEGGNNAGNVGGGGGGLALENGAGLDVPTAVAGIAKRYTNNVGGLPVVPFSRSARMSDRECFEAALHPRGHSLGKIGSNGLGKQVNRFFRIAIDKGKAYLVWSKTQGDLAEFRAVMTAGLTGAPPDMPAADPCRLVVHTTVKSLHIVTADEVHRDGWNRALRYLVEGEQ